MFVIGEACTKEAQDLFETYGSSLEDPNGIGGCQMILSVHMAASVTMTAACVPRMVDHFVEALSSCPDLHQSRNREFVYAFVEPHSGSACALQKDRLVRLITDS